MTKIALPVLLVEEFVAVAVFDLNLLLNVLMLVMAVVVAVPIVRSRRKDATIAELEKLAHGRGERIVDLEADVKGVQARADAAEDAAKGCQTEIATWRARYEEQSKYTAEGAVTHLDDVLKEHREQVADRHEKIIEQLDANRVVLEAIAERLNGG